MKKEILFSMLLLLVVQLSIAQINNESSTDSLSIKGRLGLMGRWQTGNLNQISIMPNGSISFDKTSYYTAFNASYHYLKVGGFNAINDFWIYGLFQYQPNHRVFPSIHTIMGFAKSYKIDHSIVTGLGGGVNIHKKSPVNFLQIHLYTAYLNFQYETENTHEAIAIGSQIRAMLPLTAPLNFRWELSTFHSMKEASFWGGGNLFQLNILVFKNLSINVSHQTYYNHQTATGIEKTNTQMLFGIQYQFDNH